jgi:hypothetical protein
MSPRAYKRCFQKAVHDVVSIQSRDTAARKDAGTPKSTAKVTGRRSGRRRSLLRLVVVVPVALVATSEAIVSEFSIVNDDCLHVSAVSVDAMGKGTQCKRDGEWSMMDCHCRLSIVDIRYAHFVGNS